MIFCARQHPVAAAMKVIRQILRCNPKERQKWIWNRCSGISWWVYAAWLSPRQADTPLGYFCSAQGQAQTMLCRHLLSNSTTRPWLYESCSEQAAVDEMITFQLAVDSSSSSNWPGVRLRLLELGLILSSSSNQLVFVFVFCDLELFSSSSSSLY